MSNASVGYKFGADIEQANGHLMPMTCYVANKDENAARKALENKYPDGAIHPGAGQSVSADEWKDAFGGEPAAGEVRCV